MEKIDCTICGRDSSIALFRKFDLDISKCPECGLIFVNPRLPADVTLGRYNAEYFHQEYLPSLGVVDGRYDLDFFDQRYSYLLGLMAEEAGVPGGRLLEIGAGAGFFLKSAERAGWEVTGTEISEPCFNYARKELGLNVKCEQAEDLSFDGDCFDVVAIFDVIEHLFNPFKVLQSVNHVLKPGGLLIVGTPNYGALARRMLGRQWAIISPVDHLYYFTESSLAKLLDKTGFGSIEFVRDNPSLGVFETANPRNTHSPEALRAKVFTALVKALGNRFMRPVQIRGWADNLLCLAYGRGAEDLAEIPEPVLEVT